MVARRNSTLGMVTVRPRCHLPIGKVVGPRWEGSRALHQAVLVGSEVRGARAHDVGVQGGGGAMSMAGHVGWGMAITSCRVKSRGVEGKRMLRHLPGGKGQAAGSQDARGRVKRLRAFPHLS